MVDHGDDDALDVEEAFDSGVVDDDGVRGDGAIVVEVLTEPEAGGDSGLVGVGVGFGGGGVELDVLELRWEGNGIRTAFG
jgi:hypothetical protein